MSGTPLTAETVLASLNKGLHAAMEQDESVFLLGEDVLDPYGGAFKVARGLSSAFPNRVYSSPISEAGITAIGTGMALRGCKAVVEIMFGDFVLLAMDQLVNHAAKYRWMYNDQVRVPLVVRTPMGGRRGYGPTHSQSLEKHLLGVPGLTVVAPHVLGNPGSLLRTAIDHDDPVLFIENKVDYASRLVTAVDGASVATLGDAPFETTWVAPDRFDAVLLCYGGMVPYALKAVKILREEEELAVALAIPSQLSPTPTAALEHVASVAAAHGARTFITVEESTVAGGWGAEIIATLEAIRDARGYQAATYRRIGAYDSPIPSSREQEARVLPQEETIVSQIVNCF